MKFIRNIAMVTLTLALIVAAIALVAGTLYTVAIIAKAYGVWAGAASGTAVVVVCIAAIITWAE